MMRVVLRSGRGKTLIFEGEVLEDETLKVSFSGDFFAYPSECIEELEREISTCKTLECVEDLIGEFREKCELLGISWDDILGCLRKIFETNK